MDTETTLALCQSENHPLNYNDPVAIEPWECANCHKVCCATCEGGSEGGDMDEVCDGCWADLELENN